MGGETQPKYAAACVCRHLTISHITFCSGWIETLLGTNIKFQAILRGIHSAVPMLELALPETGPMMV